MLKQSATVQILILRAIIGMILVEIIMVLMIFVESSNIIEVIGGILIAGFGGALYGFGYAFGMRWLLGWAAGALHYSGHVLDAGFLWWICTGRKEVKSVRNLIFPIDFSGKDGYNK